MTEDVPRTFPDIKSFDEEQQQLLDRCEGSQRRYAHLEATEARAQRLCRCELDVCRPLVPGSNPEIGYCQAQVYLDQILDLWSLGHELCRGSVAPRVRQRGPRSRSHTPFLCRKRASTSSLSSWTTRTSASWAFTWASSHSCAATSVPARAWWRRPCRSCPGLKSRESREEHF